jgi:hypothetical protein
VRRHAEVSNQMRDAVSEYPGLSRTGTGHHQHGPIGGSHALSLGGIEAVEQRRIRDREG